METANGGAHDAHASPPSEAIVASLRTWLPSTGRGFEVRAIEELSPAIGNSRVWRVSIARPSSSLSVILKIPDWSSTSKVEHRDPLVGARERLLAEHGVLDRLPPGLTTPRVLALDRRDDHTWIWFEDVGRLLHVTWTGVEAVRAVKGAVLLHLFHEAEPRLAHLPWLSRREYAAYAHHIPAAVTNLGALSGNPRWAPLFSPIEVGQLQQCLSSWDAEQAALESLPRTLLHGDFHVGNLGFSPDGSLILIDWASTGLAPAGCDVATFVSLYKAFRGRQDRPPGAFDEMLLDAYIRALVDETADDALGDSARRAYDLWHVTWGLHLRLGPGLGALLAGVITSLAEEQVVATDIREGCEQALRAWARLGLGS